jgi:DNA-binding response OmpR family regulator
MKEKITIVEDDDDLRSLLKLMLEAAGYDVDVRSDGNDFFNKSSDRSDLYIIDLNLGGINGLDLCKQLKGQIKNNTPVIMISANPDVRQLAKDACADDTLSKPFTSKELLAKITQYLPSSEIIS